MLCVKRVAGWWPVSVCLLVVCACSNSPVVRISNAAQVSDPLTHYALAGAVSPVLDPSIMRQGSTYYSFSTDVEGFPSSGHLPIHCSQDLVNWTLCGSVFPGYIPAWVAASVPHIKGLWAPDISYFNGLYHVYYCGSTLGSNRTVIGLATNTTLDPGDPAYAWVDRGLVLQSVPGDNFNALDPTILVDTDGSIWLTYGSYWSGIKQRQIDAQTGMLLSSNRTVYSLATRPGVPHNPIEGASLVHYAPYYYLFVSIDYCCKATLAEDNYKEAVGRSTSPHGGFVDESGTPMLEGGGTVLLQGNANWNAPGGGTAYIEGSTGESLFIFHAQDLNQGGTPFQWVNQLNWVNGWPVIGNLQSAVVPVPKA
jgi:arabinan endo-1,5-alpha-L-arabinosidase